MKFLGMATILLGNMQNPIVIDTLYVIQQYE